MIHLRKNNQVTSGDLVIVMGVTMKMSWDMPECNPLDDLRNYMTMMEKEYEERWKIPIPDHYKNLLSEMENDLK